MTTIGLESYRRLLPRLCFLIIGKKEFFPLFYVYFSRARNCKQSFLSSLRRLRLSHIFHLTPQKIVFHKFYLSWKNWYAWVLRVLQGCFFATHCFPRLRNTLNTTGTRVRSLNFHLQLEQRRSMQQSSRAKNVSKYSNILMPSRASYFFRPDDATTSMALKQK